MNNPKPQEWKSEELSKGRIIDYKAFNFVDGEGVLGLSTLAFPIPKS